MSTPEILFRQFSNSSFEEGTFSSVKGRFGSLVYPIRVSNHTPIAILELIDTLCSLPDLVTSATYILGPFYYDHLDVQIGVTGGVYRTENCYDAANREMGEEIGLLSKNLKECHHKSISRDKKSFSKFLVPITTTFPVTSAIKKIGTDNGKRIASIVYGSLDEIKKYLGSSIVRWGSADKIVGVAAIRLDFLQRALKAPQKCKHIWKQDDQMTMIKDKELGKFSTSISIDSLRKFVSNMITHVPKEPTILNSSKTTAINVNHDLLIKLIYSTLNLPGFSLSPLEKEIIESTHGKCFPDQMALIGKNHVVIILTHCLIQMFPTATENFSSILDQILGDSLFPIIEAHGLKINLIDDHKTLNLFFSLVGLCEFILKKGGITNSFEVLEERLCFLFKIEEMIKRTIESINMTNMYESLPQIKMISQ